MNRSDFLSAMAAVFCGVLLPEPVRETIRMVRLNEVLALGSPDSSWSQLCHFDGGEAHVVDYISVFSRHSVNRQMSFGMGVSG